MDLQQYSTLVEALLTLQYLHEGAHTDRPIASRSRSIDDLSTNLPNGQIFPESLQTAIVTRHANDHFARNDHLALDLQSTSEFSRD